MIIKLIIWIMCIILIKTPVYAQSIDETIERYFTPFSDNFSRIMFSSINIFGNEIPILMFLIILTSIFCTIYFRGLNLWGFMHAIKKVFAKSTESENKEGEVSTFGALATALSGTIGIGNIAGVAIAISIGGPGAMFWMCIGAFFGMVIKFCEVTLALRYRHFNKDGSISGGPMFYIERGFAKRRYHALGKTLSYIFALALIPATLSGGCMLQTNQALSQLITITGGDNSLFTANSWLFGFIVAILVGLVIVGGIKSIANVTSKVVPIMCVIYAIACFIVILVNISHIYEAISIIVHDAFFPQSIYGGIAGTIIIGLRRSLQSNEAGIGSSPIAYAAVKTDEPASQGFIAMIEPFFDTVIICSMTAFVIILTGEYTKYSNGISGVELTSAAFQTVLPFFPYILAIVIILFALSTILSWAYYGQRAWSFLVGEGKKRMFIFNIIICLFIIIGSCMNIRSIIDFTDATYMVMASCNLIAICVLLKDVKLELIKYCKKHNVVNVINKSWFQD